jgi:hypothetical protein
MISYSKKEYGPTEISYDPWIYLSDKKFQNLEGGGKWMLFYPKTEIDEKWGEIKKLYNNEELIGIKSLKVSTNYDNSRSSDKSYSVIICYCGPPNDKENLIKYGENLRDKMNYTSSFGTMSYKSDEQTLMGTRATGNTSNSLYKIPCNKN